MESPPNSRTASPRDQVAFIGRQRELAYLTERLDAAAKGERGIVLISGEPGVGKTRLLAEAAAEAESKGWRVLLGHAYDSEGMPPYLPFIEALHEYVRISPLHELIAQLGEGAAELALVLPEIRRRLPDLPASAPLDAEGARYRLFEAAAGFLDAIARSSTAGLLLCLDDLQWADDSTLLLLEHLVRRPAGTPLLILATYRDTDLDMARPLARTLAQFSRQRLSQRLDIKRLSQSDVSLMLAALGHAGPPAPLIAAVYSETEGNPFFVQEVFDYLADEGRLFDAAGAWRTDLRLGEIDVPQGVRLVIGRRLERLSEECRRVLGQASILGRTFDYPLLRNLVELDEEALLGSLEEAEQAQLLVSDAGGNLTFAHELIRQTLFSGLTALRRQRLHSAAAEAIETLYAPNLEPHIAALATHYRLAGAAADAEKAIDYSVWAGETARGLFAYDEAASHWRAALELMVDRGGDLERRARLQEQLGVLLCSTSIDFGAGIAHLEAALELYDELGLAEEGGLVHTVLSRYFERNRQRMDLERAMAHMRAAEPVLAHGPERPSQVQYYAEVAFTAMRAVQAQGFEASRRALEICERLGNQDPQGVAAIMRGYFLAAGGYLAEGYALAAQAAQKEEGGEPLSLLSLSLADPRAAARGFEAAAGKPGRVGYQRWIQLRGLAEALVDSGDLAAARALVDEGMGPELLSGLAFRDGEWDKVERFLADQLAANRAIDYRWAMCGPRNHNLAQLYRIRGQTQQAEAILLEVLAIALDGEHLPFEMSSRADLALLYADSGRTDDALVHLKRCREIMDSGEDWRGLAGRALLAEAIVAAEKRAPEADVQFAQAIAIFQHMHLPWDEAEALRLWGRSLLRARRRAAAFEKLDAAGEVYRRYGAGQPWLDLVEADKGRSGIGSTPSPVYPDGLSEREVEVLRLVAAGKSNQQIADELFISLNTVTHHISNIFNKSASTNRTEAAAYAHRSGLA